VNKVRREREKEKRGVKTNAPTPISDHAGWPSRSVVNLNTLALTAYVVSSPSSPSPSPPWSPGDIVRARPSSSTEPSVAGVSPRVAAAAAAAAGGGGAGVPSVVDAGVDPAVLVVGAGAPPAGADDVDVKPPKTEAEAPAPAPAAAADEDDERDGEPNEKPTLPALGGVDDPSLPPGATPKPNCAGVVVVVVIVVDGDDGDAAALKVNRDGFAGEPNGPPKTLLGGGSDGALSLSLSSTDFVVVAELNMLPLDPEELAVPPKSFAPGARAKENGAGVDDAGLSFSLSFSSAATLSEPNSAEVFGGLLKSRVLDPLVPPPKGKALDVGPVDENAPSGNAGFSEGVDSVSFEASDAGGLKGEDEDAAPEKPEKGEDETAEAGLGSEDAGAADAKLKGDGSIDAGAAELVAAKAAKLEGGTGIVAGADAAAFVNENGLRGMEGLLGALCVLA